MELRDLLCSYLKDRGFRVYDKGAIVNHLLPESQTGDFWTIWVERPDGDAEVHDCWKFPGSEVEVAIGRKPENASLVYVGDRRNSESVVEFRAEDPRSLERIVQWIDEIRQRQLVRDRDNLADCLYQVASRLSADH